MSNDRSSGGQAERRSSSGRRWIRLLAIVLCVLPAVCYDVWQLTYKFGLVTPLSSYLAPFGFVGGLTSLVSTPVAVVLTVVWASRLRRTGLVGLVPLLILAGHGTYAFITKFVAYSV